MALRPIRPDDADALVAFHSALSPETIYRRFFSGHRVLSAKEVEHFTTVDFVDRFAFVASIDERIVAVSRFDRDPQRPHAAEVAFVVADEHQGRGVGSLLIEQLAAVARERDITTFEADTLFDNRAMLGVFRDAGFPIRTSLDSGIVHVTFPIAPTDDSFAKVEERERRAQVASVRRLLRPSSVAVIGAGRRPGSIGHDILRNLRRTFAGPVFAVNRSGEDVDGAPTVRSIADVGQPVDLAVIAVPAAEVPDVVEACGHAGVGSVVIVSTGFAEEGPEGRARQEALVQRARALGVRIVGPSSMGVVNNAPGASLQATFAHLDGVTGGLGYLSQGGALAVSVLEHAAQRGLGVSTFVSVGTRADVSGNDLLQHWEADPSTSVVLLHLESFGNPRKFARIARRVARTKPVVIVHSGRSATGDGAFDALFRQAGVIRVGTTAELLDVALLLTHQAPPPVGRVAIVGHAGGAAHLAADACLDARLEIAAGQPLELPVGASPEDYERALTLLLADPGVDAAVVIHTPPTHETDDAVAAAVVRAAATAPAKTVVATFLGSLGGPGTLPAVEGAARRVPVFPFPERAIRALGHAAGYGRWLARPHGSYRTFDDVDLAAAVDLVERAVEGTEPVALGDDAVDALLATAGITRSVAPPSGVRVIVRLRQDPSFGPLVAFSVAGPTTELFGDVAHRILPLTDVDAAELVRSLRSSPLLLGHDGAVPVAIDALEELLLRVAALGEAVTELAELVLEPVVDAAGVHVVRASAIAQASVLGPPALSRALR